MLKIVYPDGDVAIVDAVPASRRPNLSALFGVLQELWLESELAIDDRHWKLCQKIANLLPRLDIPGQFGFPVRPLVEGSFAQARDLFFRTDPQRADGILPQDSRVARIYPIGATDENSDGRAETSPRPKRKCDRPIACLANLFVGVRCRFAVAARQVLRSGFGRPAL